MKKYIYFLLPFLIILFSTIWSFKDDNNNKTKYETVKKTSFDLKLVQRGTLEASRFVQIKSSILSSWLFYTNWCYAN